MRQSPSIWSEGAHTLAHTHTQFPSTSLPTSLSRPRWLIKADTWQPTFWSKASAHWEAAGLMSASIILTLQMTLASAYTALTDAWGVFLGARGRKYYCKSIQVWGWVLLTAITKTKSPSAGEAEAAITSLRGGLLIFCSLWTRLLALQLLKLGFWLKNAHKQRCSRDTFWQVQLV